MSTAQPPERTVGDARSGYSRRGEVPAEFPRWQKKTYRVAGTFQVSGPGTLAGVIVRRVAADVNVTLYDASSTVGTLEDQAIAAPVGVTGAAGNTGGFVNMPIRMDLGIVAVISAAADVSVYFA